jgi:VWFA-related protein
VAVPLAAIALVALGAQDAPWPAKAAPVRLDLVVVDRMEHAVLGLQAADFEVLEDGARRPITRVEFHRRGGADPPPIETDEAAARAARNPGTRVYAFFLDELHVSAANADLVRKTMAAFIEEKLEKSDLVGVMTPFEAARSVRFTRDRAYAYGVIDSFEGRKGDDRPRTPHEARVREAAAAGGGGQARIVKTGLRDLALRLGEMRAERPLLVVASEGFPAQTDPVRTPLDDLGGLLRAASRFHITTFAFNPAADAPDPAAAATPSASLPTLPWLAAEAGGRAVGASQFLYGVARLFHDTEAYYALTYQPAEPDGRFRPLDIRVKRSGVTVLSHRGHWAMRESDWREVVSLPGAPVPAKTRSLRRSPFVDAWVGLRPGAGGLAQMVITWEPRSRLDGSARVVAVKAVGADGAALFERRVAPLGTRTTVTPDAASFTAPPGRLEVDLTILDAQGTILDTDVRHVDVPELRSTPPSAPVLLPPWLVRAPTPRALQLAAADLQMAPAASRAFYRSQHLLVRVPVFDPGGEGARVTAALLNQRGVPMRELDPLGPARDGVTDFSLPLAGLASGDYQLEVRAVNPRGAATERLSFRIIG